MFYFSSSSPGPLLCISLLPLVITSLADNHLTWMLAALTYCFSIFLIINKVQPTLVQNIPLYNTWNQNLDNNNKIIKITKSNFIVSFSMLLHNLVYSSWWERFFLQKREKLISRKRKKKRQSETCLRLMPLALTPTTSTPLRMTISLTMMATPGSRAAMSPSSTTLLWRLRRS